MPVTEVLNNLGIWRINLSDQTPDEILKQLTFLGHVCILDGPVEVDGANGTLMLQRARYVGVLQDRSRTSISGDGLRFWLGDNEGGGPILASTSNIYEDNTLGYIVTTLLTATDEVTEGTVHPQVDSAARYTGDRRWETIREAFDLALPEFDAECRVNGDFTVDVGTGAQLYGSNPTAIIVRNGGGRDLEYTGIGGEFDTDQSIRGFYTGVTMLGQTKGDRTIPRRAADATGVPYSGPLGQPLKRTKLIDVPSIPEGTLQQHTDKELARVYRARRAVTIDLAEWETDVEARCGEYVYVYDPETGLVDTANEVFFRGQVLHPAVERVSQATWQVREGMTVAFRTHTGVWLDLTRFVEFETGTDELTVGEVPATLLGKATPASSVKAREDAKIGVDGKVNDVAPAAPTGLALETSSTLDSEGKTHAVIHAVWDPPTVNTDGTTFTDAAGFNVQWHWTGRAAWESQFASDPAADLPAAPGLPYAVRVQARDSDGMVSAWSTAETITSAQDLGPPPVPSAPVVSSYLGMLRIDWDGLGSTGETMPADFARVDVHVSDTTGFTPSPATKEKDFLAKGSTLVDTPYGETRYVKLIAYDHQGNASNPSLEGSGASEQVAEGDVASVNVGSLTSGELTAVVAVVDGELTIADTDGPHVRLNGGGQFMFEMGPDGVPVESGSWGTGEDGFTLRDPATGLAKASFTRDGGTTPAWAIAGTDTDGDGVPDSGFQVYGREWSDILWNLPWGTVASGDHFNSDGSLIRSGINTAVGIGELAFTAVAGRSYLILMSGLQVSTSVAGTRGLWSIRATHGGTTPTISNGVAYESAFFYLATASQGYGAPTFNFERSYSEETRVRMALIVARQSGTGLINVDGYTPSDAHFAPLRWSVIDSGPAVEDTFILNDGSGSGSGSPTNPKKTYTTTWLQNWGATYTGSGPERTDVDDLIQGFTSYYSAPGTMRALTALSGHAAAYSTDGGELTKTIVQALTGATVKKVEVKLHCHHTYSYAGGDAAIGYHTSLTKPGSYPAAAYGILTYHFDRGQTRWISLPSSTFADWASGNYRGITIGPKSSAAGDYMRFTGAGSNRPAIRITYVR